MIISIDMDETTLNLIYIVLSICSILSIFTCMVYIYYYYVERIRTCDEEIQNSINKKKYILIP